MGYYFFHRLLDGFLELRTQPVIAFIFPVMNVVLFLLTLFFQRRFAVHVAFGVLPVIFVWPECAVIYNDIVRYGVSCITEPYVTVTGPIRFSDSGRSIS